MNFGIVETNQLELTILLKRAQEVLGYHLCRAALYHVTLYKMNQLTVFKQRNGRR
jgi:hypothetical protein